MDAKRLSTCYRLAGEDFLASDLELMFRKIETPEDTARHNVIQEKIFAMIGQDMAEVNVFYRMLSHKLLHKRAKLSFLQQVAELLNRKR